MAKNTGLTKIKTGTLQRNLALGSMLVVPSVSMMGAKFANKFLGRKIDEQALMQSLIEKNIKAWVDELSEMKGLVMKAGQMLSTFDHQSVPPELQMIMGSIAKEFRRLADDSQYLNGQTIQQILARRYSKETLSELRIDEQPIAAASIGQVHLATIVATGERICLKIQYPGIRKAIDADLKALKAFVLKVSRAMGTDPHGTFQGVIEELGTVVKQEMDYLAESKKQEFYRAFFAQHPSIVIPKIFPEYTTPTILAMEYVEGVTFDHPSVLNLSRERKQRLGDILLEATLAQLFELGMYQSDAHVGNYYCQLDKRGEQDKIVFLDFGAAIKLTRSLQEELLRTSVYACDPGSNAAEIMAPLQLDGIVGDVELGEIIEALVNRMHREIHQVGAWHFTPGHEREILAEIHAQKDVLGIKRMSTLKQIPKNLTMLGRGLGGLKNLFLILDYRLDVQAVSRRIELLQSQTRRAQA